MTGQDGDDGGAGSPRRDRAALRRCVLALSLLDAGGPLATAEPAEDGVRLLGGLGGWAAVATAVADDDPLAPAARARVARLLRLVAAVRSAADPAERLLERVRLVALPAGHADHLGGAWRRSTTLGGGLDLGLGVLGLLDDPDTTASLPPGVWAAAGLDPGGAFARAGEHAAARAALAVPRLERDAAGGRTATLRAVGGCDVLALLTTSALRAWLAHGDGYGMRAVAVPMRSRGWYDLAHVDPAFVGAAWAATPPHERGVAVPLLVTADEVGLARTPDGGPVRPGPEASPRRPAGRVVRPRRPPG